MDARSESRVRVLPAAVAPVSAYRLVEKPVFATPAIRPRYPQRQKHNIWGSSFCHRRGLDGPGRLADVLREGCVRGCSATLPSGSGGRIETEGNGFRQAKKIAPHRNQELENGAVKTIFSSSAQPNHQIVRLGRIGLVRNRPSVQRRIAVAGRGRVRCVRFFRQRQG